MSKTGADLRQDARLAVERARKHLQAGDEFALRYACLELRLAVEFITYSLLQVYLAEVPDNTVKKWTPRDVIAELLNADEHADKTVRLYVGLERERGVPSDAMQDMGKDRRLGRKEIVRFHNSMGSFLHAPTLEQLERGKGVSPDKIRAKAEEVVRNLDEVLASRVFNINFGNFVTFTCSECLSPIKRKIEGIDKDVGVVCRKVECGAIFDMTEEDGKAPQFSLRWTSGRCPKCSDEWRIPTHRLGAGEVVRCGCGTRWQIVYTIREMVEPSESAEPG